MGQANAKILSRVSHSKSMLLCDLFCFVLKNSDMQTLHVDLFVNRRNVFSKAK